MPTPAESADLILKLYELRREPVLRQARTWFAGEFNPATFEEFSQVLAGEKSPWLRMVITYWDMAGSLVTFGAIDPEMFQASNGELFGVFAKVEPFLDQMREQWKVPAFLKYLEQAGRQFPDAETRLSQLQEQYRARATAATGTASKSEE